MSGIGEESLILFFVIFATGVLIGAVVLVAFAYRREDRRGSIHGKAPGVVCQGARRLTGVGTIGPAGWIHEPRPRDRATTPTTTAPMDPVPVDAGPVDTVPVDTTPTDPR